MSNAFNDESSLLVGDGVSSLSREGVLPVDSEEVILARLLGRCREIKATPDDSRARYFHDLSLGEGGSQGDKIFQYVGTAKDFGLDKLPIVESAFSDGPVSPGSSHVLRLSRAKRFELPRPHPLVACFVHVAENGQFVVEHNEHAWHTYSQPGWYVVRHQRAKHLDEATLVPHVDVHGHKAG